ncbi:Retrovirus-related Pol polyprotein from transposon TNT 1-94 [Sesamum angolense]|uniref:Retrovirus-related Pol polyprotein from transposon TNT 1-94 n=1 Tax=Sesamum angolense TaxID=2727404 RepID=A0AAE2BLG6_9LAMI|nr:Retrovirus-related Pol polyprotein from transposon TNT 1-94 [Sesamum angolense]
MTKKSFVGHSAMANSLLDLIHTDVCGPLNTPTRGEYSYFITFTDDHSQYGYVYLMRYKSEAIGRFKEYRLEVENYSGRKIKALRSDRDASFQSEDDVAKSQSSFVFKLNDGVVAWKSSEQATTVDSTTKAEYIVALEATMEAIWMKNYI